MPGIAGRSLKCRRTAVASGQLAPLSELRFNLPSSQALRSTPKSSHAGAYSESKRSSYFSASHHRASSSVSADAAAGTPDSPHEDTLDLSLCQEHAGGGFGGKQAKLGKLIIEPKGLQMLDLLVAANMSMWWKVYEKNQLRN